MTREERLEYYKNYYKNNKEKCVKQKKNYYKTHVKKITTYKSYYHEWYLKNKEKCYDYKKSDLNLLGQTKDSIRNKSNSYLRKYGKKIPGYQIHHCFGYEDPSKFIYCSKEMHLKIHQFLRDNNIDADSDHYDKIKQLLDDSVVMFNV